MHFGDHSGGSITFWYRLRRYYIALVQFDKPGDKDPLSSKNGFTQLGMDSKGRAEEIMIHLVVQIRSHSQRKKNGLTYILNTMSVNKSMALTKNKVLKEKLL